MQISPVRISLAVVTEYFGTSLDDPIRRTLPAALPFSGVLILRSLFRTGVFGV
jgi:hypothetical protein